MLNSWRIIVLLCPADHRFEFCTWITKLQLSMYAKWIKWQFKFPLFLPIRLRWHGMYGMNESEACFCITWHDITQAHAHPNVRDLHSSVNISNMSPSFSSQNHCVSEKWESILFGKPICAKAQFIREVIVSGIVLTYWTLVGNRNIKKTCFSVVPTASSIQVIKKINLN